MTGNFDIVWIHLIWSTRDRQPMIKKSFRGRLNNFIKKEAEKKGVMVDTVNGMEDHLHVLLKLKPTQSISEVTHWIKGRSSKWINENYYQEGFFRWQKGYGAFSVGRNEIDLIRNYIYNHIIERFNSLQRKRIVESFLESQNLKDLLV